MGTRKGAAGKTTARTAAGASPPTPPPGKPPESDPKKKPFTPEVLDRSAIAKPLLAALDAEDKARKEDPAAQREPHPIIIDLHLEFHGGREGARAEIRKLLEEIFKEHPDWPRPAGAGLGLSSAERSEQYVFCKLEGRVIRELVRRDRADEDKTGRRVHTDKTAIYRIWPDFVVSALVYKSVSTIKADAALNSFSTTGHNIVWAVMDSGIDALHPHFAAYDNLNLSALSLRHRDLTSEGLSEDEGERGALTDWFGHGTHVAGIIAGSMTAEQGEIVAKTRYRDEVGDVKKVTDSPPRVAGIAPRCKLLSLKVLDDAGDGRASSLIAAIAEVQRLNGNGRFIRVHGVNMSVGYDFEPEWFACGQSPLCVEVNRLVRSGVVVVVAAGNTGYGFAQSAARGTVAAGLGLTINDPGNADLAVTVGSTHRDMPHVYGVSYFSSKGPTGDGRAKPDLVAPGEKIVSCASAWAEQREAEQRAAAQGAAAPPAGDLNGALGKRMAQWRAASAPAIAVAVGAPAAGLKTGKAIAKTTANYKEDSGTSMAAPHVSGAIAAFLSVRREFIGEPEKVKAVFVSTATDLKRDRSFQGSGLVDLMRAIQSV